MELEIISNFNKFRIKSRKLLVNIKLLADFALLNENPLTEFFTLLIKIFVKCNFKSRKIVMHL